MYWLYLKFNCYIIALYIKLKGINMKYFLLTIVLTLFLKADINNINTSNFNYGWITPIEFSYINTRDDGALYHIGAGVGGYLEYDLFEVQLSGMFIPYTNSNSLFNWNDEVNIADTIKYGGTLLYKLNSNWQIGVDYSKYLCVTNKGELRNGTTYGYMSSYGIKFLYDPLADVMEQSNPLLMVFSLGYMDASNITYEKKTPIRYNFSQRVFETENIKKQYDLSGQIATIGIVKKF